MTIWQRLVQNPIMLITPMFISVKTCKEWNQSKFITNRKWGWNKEKNKWIFIILEHHCSILMKAVHYWDLLHKFKLFGIVITSSKPGKKGKKWSMFALEKQFKVLFMFFFFFFCVALDMGCQEHSKNVRLHSFVKARELHPIVLHDFGRVAQTMDWKPSTVNDNGLPELQVKNVIIRLSWGINYQSYILLIHLTTAPTKELRK